MIAAGFAPSGAAEARRPGRQPVRRAPYCATLASARPPTSSPLPSAEPVARMDSTPNASAARVTVRPSGHEFVVEGRDTLLQAGLKAGLKLDYGCGNGTCGLCKARVVSGEVTKVTPHDYPLSEAERPQGHMLLCAHSAGAERDRARDAGGDGPARHSRPRSSTVRVRGVQPLAPNTLLLHLQTPRPERLRFLAGQSVTLAPPRTAPRPRRSVRRSRAAPATSATCTSTSARDAGDALARDAVRGRAARPAIRCRLRGPLRRRSCSGRAGGRRRSSPATPDSRRSRA